MGIESFKLIRTLIHKGRNRITIVWFIIVSHKFIRPGMWGVHFILFGPYPIGSGGWFGNNIQALHIIANRSLKLIKLVYD